MVHRTSPELRSDRYIYETAFVDFTFGRSAAVAMILFVIILLVTLFQFWGQRRWGHYDD